MQYKTIRKISEGIFIGELNDAVHEGYRAVSVGASYNQEMKCLEWWAIVEKSDKVTIKVEGVTEEIKEASKRAELLEAARMIAEHCEAHGNNCNGCELWGRDGCVVQSKCEDRYPEKWIVNRRRIDDV